MQKMLSVLLLAAAPVVAFAKPVTYDFTVIGDPSGGAYAGAIANGFFTYDDTVVQAGQKISATNLFTDFQFSWGGTEYTESNTLTAWLGADAMGTLNEFMFGNDCMPGICWAFRTPQSWSVFHGASGVVNSISYMDQGMVRSGTIASWTLRETPSAAVPEPGAFVLAIAGGLAIALFGVRRRRAATRTQDQCVIE